MWVLPWHHEADMIIRYELCRQWQRCGDHRHTERRVFDDFGWQAVPEVRQIVQQTKAGQRAADPSQGALATEKAGPRQIACRRRAFQHPPGLAVRGLTDHFQPDRTVCPPSELPANRDHGVAASGHRDRAEVADQIIAGWREALGYPDGVCHDRMPATKSFLVGILGQEESMPLLGHTLDTPPCSARRAA